MQIPLSLAGRGGGLTFSLPRLGLPSLLFLVTLHIIPSSHRITISYTVYSFYFIFIYTTTTTTNALQFGCQVILAGTLPHDNSNVDFITDQRVWRLIAVMILSVVCLLVYFSPRWRGILVCRDRKHMTSTSKIMQWCGQVHLVRWLGSWCDIKLDGRRIIVRRVCYLFLASLGLRSLHTTM